MRIVGQEKGGVMKYVAVEWKWLGLPTTPVSKAMSGRQW